MTPLGDAPQLSDFGHDPLWLVLLKVVVVFVFLLLGVLFMVWFERRVLGRMQNRKGPNRAGPFGLLQPVADGVKLALKEDFIPTMADKPVYFLAPVVVATPAFVAFSVIPVGPMVSIFGTHTPLQVTDLPVGVLVVLALTSMAVYGVVLMGWASGSSYPLLGGLRSAAQMISYEIAMGLSFVAVFLYAGSLSTSEIVRAQHDLWFVLPLCVSAVIYFVSAVGETNRAPFDLPEAESELVGGFHAEYTSSLKFGMYMLAEYVYMIVACGLATTMFLGGWRAPWPLSLWDGANSGWWPALWWLGKTLLLLCIFIWLRGSLPRLRYDQFMKFGWKVLVPVALAWIVFISSVRMVRREFDFSTWQVLLVVGAVIVVALLLLAFVPSRGRRAEPEDEPAEPSFPIPPMDLVVPTTPRVSASRMKAPAAVGGRSNRQARRGSTTAALEEGESGETNQDGDRA